MNDSHTKEDISSAAAGDRVTFGTYSGEAIEWMVPAVDGTHLLMLSEKGIDTVCYMTDDDSGYPGSNIRKCLNDTFYNSAFNREEKKRLMSAGTADDKVRLLSPEEAKSFFPNAVDRACYPTEQALKSGARTSDSGIGKWWLRHDGGSHCDIAYLCFENGLLYDDVDKEPVYSSGYLARPVILLSAE